MKKIIKSKIWDNIKKNNSEIDGITMTAILRKSRAFDVVQVRRFLIVELKSLGFQSNEIGGFLNVDHSTVLFHVKKHWEFMRQYAAYRERFENFTKNIIL